MRFEMRPRARSVRPYACRVATLPFWTAAANFVPSASFAIETADNFTYRDVRFGGIATPKGGFASRHALAAELRRHGREGELDDRDTWTASKAYHDLPPIGARVDPVRKAVI